MRKTDSIKTGHCNALQSFSMCFRVRCFTCLTTLLWTKQNYKVFLNLNAVNKWVLHIYQSFLHPSQYLYSNPWSQRITFCRKSKKNNTMKKINLYNTETHESLVEEREQRSKREALKGGRRGRGKNTRNKDWFKNKTNGLKIMWNFYISFSQYSQKMYFSNMHKYWY